MAASSNPIPGLIHDFSVFWNCAYNRAQQKYVYGVDPEVYPPDVPDEVAGQVDGLLEEFDYAEAFRKARSFYPILFLRRRRAHPRLSNWMNKIWLGEYCQSIGVPTLTPHYASYEGAPSAELLRSLPRYVAKPAHMSEGDCVFVVSGDTDLKSGQKVDADHVAQRLDAAMSSKTRGWDTWGALHSRPGVIVEEMSSDRDGNYVSMPDEIKIFCVWGRVYFGVWRQHYNSHGFLYRDRSNDHLSGANVAWWPEMVTYAEAVAKGTDLLRVDMFINGGRPVLNEVEIMPVTPVPRALQREVAGLLNAGYARRRSV